MDNIIEYKSDNSQAELRGKIVQLESKMNEMKEHIVHIEPVHYFANGLYAREIKIPKGVLLTGHIHKTEHLCVLSLGEVTVYTDEGMKRIKASTVVHSSPGTKRAMYAHEDSVWINFHHNPTNETDLEKIEAIYVVDSYEKLEQTKEQKYLSSSRSFDDVLSACEITSEKMREISEKEDDRTMCIEKTVYLGASEIEGIGVFTDNLFKVGDKICAARLSGSRTTEGRFCNHSGTPNAEMVMDSIGDVYIYAIKDISKFDEITTDYFFNFKNTRLENLNKECA